MKDEPQQPPPWLFFMFQLPARQASRRVSVWRRLKAYGALGWRNSAYVLPNTADNLERLHWLAKEMRKYSGEASVVVVQHVEGVSDKDLRAAFNAHREREYERLVRLLRAALKKGRRGSARAEWTRLQRQFEKIVQTDYFQSAHRRDAEALLRQLERRVQEQEGAAQAARPAREGYKGRTWMTRPRPAIDRVASAWLIRNFIDPEASFAFAANVAENPDAIAFDMYDGEFTHEGDSCTFEVLRRRFALKESRLEVISEMVHDADLEDDKFHRAEGAVLHSVFQGWAALGWTDEEILGQGFRVLDGLFRSLPLSRLPTGRRVK